MPGTNSFFSNFAAPLPLHQKLFLTLRNLSIKIWKRQSCCGHPVQPGC